MKLRLSSIYEEAGIYFDISFKVLKVIRKEIVNHLISNLKLEESRNLVFRTTTKKNQFKIEIEKYIEGDIVTYYIKLPYEEISKNKDQRESFLKYYFDGLVMVFKDFDIDEESIREIEEIVKKEVLDNDEYKYIDKSIKVDLSKLGL